MLQVELMCGKKNKQPGDFYGVDDITWGSFADQIPYGGGVFDVFSFEPKIVGSSVQVGKGYILIKNTTYTFGANTPAFWLVRNTDPITLSVPPNTTSQTRFDSIVVVVNQRATDPLSDPDARAVVEVKYIPGTVSGRSNTYAELAALPELSGKDFTRVAKVAVPAGSSAPSDIADWRVPLGVFDGVIVQPAKNWFMNSEIISPRWGWYASDWSRVLYSDVSTWYITTTTAAVTVGFNKIYSTSSGEMPPMFPGKEMVLSARVHKVSGTAKVSMKMSSTYGSSVTTDVTKTIYLDGDSNNELTWVMLPVELKSADYQSVELTVHGGNTNVYWSHNKLEFGNRPTAWQPRPLAWRDKWATIYPWATSFAGIASGTLFNMLSYGATKRTIAAEAILHYRDDDSWSWVELQGINESGAWIRALAVENQNGIPVRRQVGKVWLNTNYQMRLVKDVGGQSGTLGAIEIKSYYEYV